MLTVSLERIRKQTGLAALSIKTRTATARGGAEVVTQWKKATAARRLKFYFWSFFGGFIGLVVAVTAAF